MFVGIKDRLDGTKEHWAIGRKRVKRKNYVKGQLRTSPYIAERVDQIRMSRAEAVNKTADMTQQEAILFMETVRRLCNFIDSEPRDIVMYCDPKIELLFERGRRRSKVFAHNMKAAMVPRGKVVRHNG